MYKLSNGHWCNNRDICSLLVQIWRWKSDFSQKDIWRIYRKTWTGIWGIWQIWLVFKLGHFMYKNRYFNVYNNLVYPCKIHQIFQIHQIRLILAKFDCVSLNIKKAFWRMASTCWNWKKSGKCFLNSQANGHCLA